MTEHSPRLPTLPPGAIGPKRRTWMRPTLRRLSAGSAEIGANPQRPEGAFASGGS